MGTSTVSQIVALQAMARIDELARVQRDEVRTSLDLAETALRLHVPDWTWRRPSGGRSLWARLPRGDAGAFAQIALLHGVAISAGPTLAFGDDHGSFVRVPFVHEPETIREAGRRLGDAWTAYASSLR
jgi:DNA-binding transcriptional MocR family regulator